MSKENDFTKKINPRLYGLIFTLIGIGVGIITVRYVQDNGFFDLSGGFITGLLAVPILIIGTFVSCVGGIYYLIKGKWIEK